MVERIKQALDRARAERGRVGQVQALATGPEIYSGAPDGAVSPQPVGSAVPLEITYKDTRIVHVSQESLRERRIVAGMMDVPASAVYKVLRTQILQRMTGNGWTTLGITSASASAGKTVTAANLAVALAGEVNHTVLLVDADLRRPAVHECFDRLDTVGLIDHLVDAVPLTEMLFNPGIPRLVVLPGGPPVMHSSEMLGSPQMRNLLDELKGRYCERLIIFDLPPVLASDDVLAFSPLIDALLLVIEDGRTRNKDLKRVFDLLDGHAVIGTVLNKSAGAGAAYYY